MRGLRHFLGCVLVLWCGASSGRATELRLVVRHEGRILPVTALENNRIVAQDGDRKILLRHDASYELEGDLLANADQILWAPNYSIRTDEEAMKGVAAGVAAVGQVALRHLAEMDGKKMPSAFFEKWPEGAPEGGIMLLAWVVDGKLTQLAVDKIPSTKTVRFFVAAHDFMLSPVETGGQGLMLFWVKGRFVAPKPRFKDTRAQQSLAAMLLGDLAPLRAALSDGMKPSIKGYHDETLLHFAAEAGLEPAVDLLVRQGASLNAAERYGGTPLHWAASKGRQAAVTRLLAEKVNVDVARNDSSTPLHLAVEFGHVTVAEALINRKASVNAVNRDLQSPYSLAIDRGYAALARLIVAKGGKGQSDREQLQRVLLTQAGKGNTDMVQFLIEQKTGANFEHAGRRPLAAGAISGDARMVSILLAGGAGIDEANTDGLTPLMFASGNGSLEYVRALLEAGADVKRRDKMGRSCLHYAAIRNMPGLMELLLAKGADPLVRDRDQLAPLDLALLTSAGTAAQALDQAGASVDLQSRQVAVLLEAALKLDLAGVVGRALAGGWSANTRFHDSWPALLVAETCQANKCAALLRGAGAEKPADAPVVVGARQVDQAPRLLAVTVPADPRDLDGVFPAALVEIDVVIDGQGRVRFPVVHSAPDWLIAQAALQSLGGWRFAPLTRQGQPVATRLRLPVEFVASSDLAFNAMLADVMPLPLKRVSPSYPVELQKSSQQGVVMVAFTVGVDGRVKDARVIGTSSPAFNQPALDAIQKWIFKPGEVDGQPAPIRTRQEIIFQLN